MFMALGLTVSSLAISVFVEDKNTKTLLIINALAVTCTITLYCWLF